MTPTSSSRARLLLAFAIVYLVWGSTYLAIRYAIVTIPPFLMAGVRFLVAGTVLYTWVRLRTGERPTSLQWRNTTIIGVLLLAGGNGGVVWAEQTVPSGITALLVATVPLWIVVLMWVRPGGRRPSAGVAAGIIVGLVGMGVLVGWDALHGGTIPLAGVAALTAGSLSWSAGSLYAQSAKLPSPLMTTAMEMLTGGAALFLMGLATREPARFDAHAVTVVSVAGLLYLIVFGSLIAFTAYGWLLQHASPVAVGTYAYVNPVVAVFLGWLVAHEPVTVRTLVGAAVIVAGVAIITTAQARDRARR